MFIPYELTTLSKLACHDSNRWRTMAGVEVRRVDKRLQLTVTDGRRMVRATVDDADATRWPAVAGHGQDTGDLTTYDEYRTVVDGEAFAQIPKAAPKRGKSKDTAELLISKRFLLQEGETNGTVDVIATNLETLSRQTVPTIEGDFPDVEAVIPKGTPQASVVLDANLLAEILTTMNRAAGRGKADALKLRLSIYSDGSPVRFESTPEDCLADGLKLDAVLMPVCF